jgi:hypothetical protein
LPFTADVLASLMAGYNRSLWPAQIGAYAVALALVWLAAGRRDGGVGRLASRLFGVALVAAWAWSGAVFLGQVFAGINFLAPVYAALFLLQALLLAWTGILRGAFAPRLQAGFAGWAGLGLIAYALAGYPLLSVVAGQPLAAAPVVGLAPGPTAVFTLGVLMLLAPPVPLHLAVVPVLWTLIAGATAWVLTVPGDLAAILLGPASLALLAWKNRQQWRSDFRGRPPAGRSGSSKS